MNRAATVACALALVTNAVADPPDLPLRPCLPPRSDSCAPRPKKDPTSHAAVPRLLPVAFTLVSVHTGEALALGPTPVVGETAALERFFRDRTTWETHAIAPACIEWVRRAVAALGGRRVEVVSAYRSDKMNEMLRKKGHHVARHSQHVLGNAIDFRIVGVPTRALFRWIRHAHRGGTGLYTESDFVHLDVGSERSWNGE